MVDVVSDILWDKFFAGFFLPLGINMVCSEKKCYRLGHCATLWQQLRFHVTSLYAKDYYYMFVPVIRITDR